MRRVFLPHERDEAGSLLSASAGVSISRADAPAAPPEDPWRARGQRADTYLTTRGTVSLNGEDYYSVPGQMVYLSANQGRFEDVVLAVNADGVGCTGFRTRYSTYGCDGELKEAISAAFGASHEFQRGGERFQGDHMISVMNDVPAVALTSENASDLSATVTHTLLDTIDLVDTGKILESAMALQRLIGRLNGPYGAG